MYDTVNLWLNKYDIAEGENPFAILQYLDDCKDTIKDGILMYSTGKIGDYRVTTGHSGISFKGSLSKHYLPSNLFTLTRQTTHEAIEMLSDQLHLDITQANVTRLDVGTVLPMQRPPRTYYTRLGAKPYFKRLQATDTTLYYNTQDRQQIFYDKTKDALSKGAVIPSSFISSNLLRYELRYRNRLKDHLKTAGQVKASQLYDEKFYYSLIQNWKDEFYKIKKINKNIDMSTIKSPTDAKDVLFATLLKDAGQSTIDEYINALKSEKVFNDPKYYTRAKNELNKLIQLDVEQEDDVIKELESAINNVAKYAH